MGESNCTIINTSSVNYFIECVFVYFMTCTVAKKCNIFVRFVNNVRGFLSFESLFKLRNFFCTLRSEGSLPSLSPSYLCHTTPQIRCNQIVS